MDYEYEQGVPEAHPNYPLDRHVYSPVRSLTPTTEECGTWTIGDDDLDSHTLQRLLLMVLFPLGLALAASIKVDMFSFVHLTSFIIHFAFPLRLFYCGEQIHVPRRTLLRLNFVTAVCGVLVQIIWQVVLLIPAVELEYDESPDIFIDLGLPRYTLFFAVVAREVLPSIVLATVCAKCISLVQILHRQPQPVHPPTSTRQDLSHVVRPLCAALFVMVGLARPSLLGATLLVLGVVCHVTWALSADYGCGLFNRLAPHAIYYVGVLLALEYLTHSRSISTFLVENKDATAVAGVLGLQGDQGIEGIDYILHEGLMLLLFLLLYYYLHNCEPAIGGEANLADSFISTPHETPLRPQILQNISHTNYGATSPEDLAGGYTSSRPRADDQQTPRLRNTSTPSSIPGSIPAVGSPFRIPTSQVRWESEPSINCETDVSGTAWDVSALQDLAHWCQAKSFPILLSLLLLIAMGYLTAFSILWVVLLLLGFLAPFHTFSRFLPAALLLAWAGVACAYVANMHIQLPAAPSPGARLLGVVKLRAPVFSLLFTALLPLFISFCHRLATDGVPTPRDKSQDSEEGSDTGSLEGVSGRNCVVTNIAWRGG